MYNIEHVNLVSLFLLGDCWVVEKSYHLSINDQMMLLTENHVLFFCFVFLRGLCAFLHLGCFHSFISSIIAQHGFLIAPSTVL